MRTFQTFAGITVGLVMALSGTGCLQTRASAKEQEEKVVIARQMKTLQQTNADTGTRFSDIDDELRRQAGRSETLDAKINQLAQTNARENQINEQRLKEMSDKLLAYQEAISKLDSQMAEMNQGMAQLQEEVRKNARAAPAASSGGGKGSTGPYANAESHFNNRSWKDAILEYEKYREGNPKGKQFADATYKIGVSFQELGMTDEATAFFREVVAKFPNSKEASKANYRLKSIKKK